MSYFSKGIVLAGIAAMIMGAGSVAAHADDFGRLNGNVRTDMEHIRRDKTRIQDLLNKRHMQKNKGDLRHAGYTSNDLAKARINLQNDQVMLARDRSLLKSYHK